MKTLLNLALHHLSKRLDITDVPRGFSFVIVFILLLSSSLNSYSQDKILVMSTAATPLPEDTTEYGLPLITDSSMLKVKMTIILLNTSDISKVHVKLGSTLNGSDLFFHTFNYGISGTFGNASYSQTNNVISLNLGNYNIQGSFYGEAQIERTDSVFETPISYFNQ